MMLEVFADTDVGRIREHNEDSFYAGDTVWAVADGLGGHQAGEVASALAIEPLEALDGQRFERAEAAQRALVEAVREANRRVLEAAAEPGREGMGTTMTAAIKTGGRLLLAHIGDSRAYLRRPGDGLSQLTTDHTYVQELVAAGHISSADARVHPERSVITRAVGLDTEPRVDAPPPIALQAGDDVLLCSDGLTETLTDSDIVGLLAGAAEGGGAVRALIAAANQAGGPDNITVVLLRVRE